MIGSIVRNLTALIGLAMIGTGLWLVHPSASITTVGALMLAAGVYPYFRRGTNAS